MTARTSSSAETLYAHIRRLLDEHIFVHLTSCYVDCTQRRVYEALTGGLLPVSVDDPHSLVLPSDPLDDFIREHCQVEFKDMHGKLTAVKEAKELINSSCAVKARPVFTSRFSHTHCGYIPSTDLFADPSVLTVRTIRYTPKLGRSKISRSVPVNLREVINQNSIELPLDDEDECINAQTKDIFDTRLVVDDHVWKKIQLLNQECTFSTAPTNDTASALSNKLLCRMPSPPIHVPLPETPPLFSRMSVVPKQLAHTPASMSDIPLLTPFTSEVGDEGTAEYEIVNDAWDISSTLSPPPSLSHGTSEQDETFIPSSESRGHIYELEKMDTFHMPRQSRIGGSSGTLKVAGQGQLFHEYISRVIDTTREPIISSSASPAMATRLISAGRAFPTPNNMCQMSDDLEDTILGPLTLDFSDDVIDAVLSNGSTDMRSGLMEVPRLPAPNVHTDSVVWPNDMSSLVANKAFSSFYVVNGVKSLNIELTWRPYNSEQEIPTLEELVGVSEPHLLAVTCIDGEETRAEVGWLLKSLDTLVHAISIEEEDRRKLQASLKSPPNLEFVTDHLNPLDCGFSNVLLTRVERHQSRMMSGSHLETETDYALPWDGTSHDIQSQGSERLKADDPSESEGDYNGGSIDFVQWDLVDLDPPAREQTPISGPIEGVPLDVESDVISAPHVQSPMDSIVLVSPVGLSQSAQAVSIKSMVASDRSIPDWIHPSKTGGVDDPDQRSLTPSGPATCEEQSLHGYLNVLAKRPSQSRLGADNNMGLTSPAGPEPQVSPTTFFDAEGLLVRELINLTGPLPLDISFHRSHRYLASVELLQDRALVRALRSDSLRIELLEREWLDGADIVFDCDTALVFAPLIQTLLASSFLSLKNKLISLSWRYTHLAVVFKLYDAFFSGLQRPRDEEEQGILITQVIKSIKKLRRDLAIAEAYATKRPQTVVQMYFVRSVELAARTTRLLGDMAESQSQLGPWGDRLWLEVDEKEDERYLAGVDGMNAFAAAAILSQISLHGLLALRADQRLELALPIPEGMMERFNEAIAQRRDDVDTFVDDDGVLSS